MSANSTQPKVVPIELGICIFPPSMFAPPALYHEGTKVHGAFSHAFLMIILSSFGSPCGHRCTFYSGILGSQPCSVMHSESQSEDHGRLRAHFCSAFFPGAVLQVSIHTACGVFEKKSYTTPYRSPAIAPGPLYHIRALADSEALFMFVYPLFVSKPSQPTVSCPTRTFILSQCFNLLLRL